jgi:hypothetical protein
VPGGAIMNRNPTDAHLLPEPLIECGSTRNLFPCHPVEPGKSDQREKLYDHDFMGKMYRTGT